MYPHIFVEPNVFHPFSCIVWHYFSMLDIICCANFHTGGSLVHMIVLSLSFVLINKATYLVQTNLSVQTMQTLIWAIGSTSKGRDTGGGRGDLQKCDYSIQGRVQIVKLLNPPCPLDVDPMTQIEVFIVCTEKLVCTSRHSLFIEQI